MTGGDVRNPSDPRENLYRPPKGYRSEETCTRPPPPTRKLELQPKQSSREGQGPLLSLSVSTWD